MLVSPAASDDTALSTLPVLHGTSDPTRDTLTAAGLMTNPQVAEAVVKALHLNISADNLLSKVTATPIGQSNLLALQATYGLGGAGRDGWPTPSPTRWSPPATANLHAALATAIPGLQAQLQAETPAERVANSTLTAELSQLQALKSEPRPDDHRLRARGPAPRPLHPEVQAGARRRADRGTRARRRRRLPPGRPGSAAAPRGPVAPPLQRAHPRRHPARAPAPPRGRSAAAHRSLLRRPRGLPLAAHLHGRARRQQAPGDPAHGLGARRGQDDHRHRPGRRAGPGRRQRHPHRGRPAPARDRHRALDLNVEYGTEHLAQGHGGARAGADPARARRRRASGGGGQAPERLRRRAPVVRLLPAAGGARQGAR